MHANLEFPLPQNLGECPRIWFWFISTARFIIAQQKLIHL